MAFLLTDFRTRFRYRVNDSEATFKYANSVVDLWGNAALEELSVLAPHILASVVIDGTGLIYQFDLSASPAVRFNLLHRLSLVGSSGHPIPEHPSKSIEYIRALENSSDGIIAGDPKYYVVVNHDDLYLDAIIAATDDLDFDYWQLPRTWVETVTDGTTQSTTPDGLLAQGQDELILGMAAIKAGNDIGGKLGDELISKYYPIVYGDVSRGLTGLLTRFEEYAAKTAFRGNKAQARYSVMGADPNVYGLMGR